MKARRQPRGHAKLTVGGAPSARNQQCGESGAVRGAPTGHGVLGKSNPTDAFGAQLFFLGRVAYAVVYLAACVAADPLWVGS